MPRKVSEMEGLELETHVIRQCSKQLDHLGSAHARMRVIDYLGQEARDQVRKAEFASVTKQLEDTRQMAFQEAERGV